MTTNLWATEFFKTAAALPPAMVRAIVKGHMDSSASEQLHDLQLPDGRVISYDPHTFRLTNAYNNHPVSVENPHAVSDDRYGGVYRVTPTDVEQARRMVAISPNIYRA